ncbi:MAG: universal stress protein [Acidobacteria bacterium]|nr:universal stress protein [Acidobacteriota bacterium]
MKIILAVDGSSCSDAAVEEVARRPWPAGSEFRIISVAELPALPTPETWVLPEGYFEEAERASQDRARVAIDKAAERLRQFEKLGPQITSELLQGHPQHVIPEYAEQWGADLIVLGSHGYRGLKRLWLGSVSHAVASHAKCSVEVVRCRQITQSLGE